MKKLAAPLLILFFIVLNLLSCDGLDPGEMSGGAFQRILNSVNVILGILLEVRVPDHFLGINSVSYTHLDVYKRQTQHPVFGIAASDEDLDTIRTTLKKKGIEFEDISEDLSLIHICRG